MLITNLDSVPGQRISKSLGVVRGQAPRVRHRVASFLARLQRLLGGELHGDTEGLRLSREQALKRMESEAKSLGANGILNVRFLCAGVIPAEPDLAVVGTAVVLE